MTNTNKKSIIVKSIRSIKSGTIRLPGLIDVHVHFRDPGQTHKEDFYTGTSAALAGGYTMVLDMPNNADPIVSDRALKSKVKSAKLKIVCDMGFHFGSLGNDLDELKKVYKKVVGLKLYLNQTTGGFIIDVSVMKRIYKVWHRLTKIKPIMLHAEEDVMGEVTKVLKEINHPTHICHVSSRAELEPIIKAKKKGLPITCGVCPHHLFLTKSNVRKLKAFGLMKPSLKAKGDQEYLWKNMQYIDVIESDHAPHTIAEKKSSTPPFGVPGLETTLPLLLTAMYKKKLTLKEIIEKCHDNPKRIFNLPDQKNTFVEILDTEYRIQNTKLKTKSGWSPFNGWKVRGKVQQVVLRGKEVYKNRKVLVRAGSGKIITS